MGEAQDDSRGGKVDIFAIPRPRLAGVVEREVLTVVGAYLRVEVLEGC